jgi:hypothetical protein
MHEYVQNTLHKRRQWLTPPGSQPRATTEETTMQIGYKLATEAFGPVDAVPPGDHRPGRRDPDEPLRNLTPAG